MTGVNSAYNFFVVECLLINTSWKKEELMVFD